jgi:hypothetical protein
VERRHDLRHLDPVRLYGELLVAVEHLTDGVAVHHEHRTKRRLKQLPLPSNLLEHRIRFELQKESDHRADCSPLAKRLDLEQLELLYFRRCERRRACLTRQLQQSRFRDRVVGDDAIEGGEEHCSAVAVSRVRKPDPAWADRRNTRRGSGGFGIVFDRKSHRDNLTSRAPQESKDGK